MGYKNNNLFSSLNLLKLSFALLIVGFTLPIGCKSNGFQIFTGILGKGAKKINFGLIEDIYGYMLLGVFILAVVGLILTFLPEIKFSLVLSYICLALGLLLIVTILYKFNFYFKFKDFSFHNKYWPAKIEFLPGFYIILAGYVVGTISFLMKVILKKD